uniref:Uncharacterized protein n=1 Tax=Oryza barthii TaxID=65489 RepID=A0A0D3G7X4_9ORYZ
MCLTKCCSSDIAPDLTVDMVVTCATATTASVEMVPAEDATSDAYIDNLKHPKKTLTNCSTNCSSLNGMTELTVVAVKRCATTVIAFVELIGIEDNGHTTCIGTSNPSKVMPTRCSTVVLNTNDDTVQALDVPPFIIGAWEVITVLAEPSQIMVLRPSITLSLEGKMHTRHSLKCPGQVDHSNKEPYSRGWQLRTALGPDSDRSAQGISFSELVGSPHVKMVEFLLGLVGTSDINHTESITSFVKERMEGKLEGENDVFDTQLVIDKRITFYFEENISASQILELLPKPISKWQDAGPDHIYILGVFHAEP